MACANLAALLLSRDRITGHFISCWFADDVIEAPDGSLYFSVASTKFGLHDWYFDVLEAKPHGQLLKYDPSFNETSIVLNGLCFANGVPLSADQDYLVVPKVLVEWGRQRENIDFWIALLQLTSGGLEYVQTSKALEHLVATFPRLLEQVKGMHTKAPVVNVATDGMIIRSFDDPDGSVMSFVTSALAFEDHLYLGSLNSNFVGKLPLNGAK
ncbi:hypothetical protein Vadar_027361 [Vaccinium darrowii]|uniref:Uncharacterized protein n=1 Tax=Vaccinium darrowii TaxID=229202 RepID=A0ACB7YHN7_9ERIC|nr:hypothetical protein Vadar_027361 [Vaccinium darrowii]